MSKEVASEHQLVVLLASATVPATFPESVEDEIRHNLVPYASFLSSLAPDTKVIFVSSGGTVYGDAPPERGSRESDPVQPRSPYGLVKLMIEDTVRYYARRRGLSFVILRPSNPIGPRHQPINLYGTKGHQGVATIFLQNILTDGKVMLIGDGSVSRDYFDVRDLASAIRMMICDGIPNDITLNIGSGKALSLVELIECIKTIVNHPFEIVRMPARTFDVGRSVLDISRIKETVGWRPEISIETSIRDTWEWLLSSTGLEVGGTSTEP
jgi:UDP-glucose 4-epimerase